MDRVANIILEQLKTSLHGMGTALRLLVNSVYAQLVGLPQPDLATPFKIAYRYSEGLLPATLDGFSSCPAYSKSTIPELLDRFYAPKATILENSPSLRYSANSEGAISTLLPDLYSPAATTQDSQSLRLGEVCAISDQAIIQRAITEWEGSAGYLGGDPASLSPTRTRQASIDLEDLVGYWWLPLAVLAAFLAGGAVQRFLAPKKIPILVPLKRRGTPSAADHNDGIQESVPHHTTSVEPTGVRGDENVDEGIQSDDAANPVEEIGDMSQAESGKHQETSACSDEENGLSTSDINVRTTQEVPLSTASHSRIDDGDEAKHLVLEEPGYQAGRGIETVQSSQPEVNMVSVVNHTAGISITPTPSSSLESVIEFSGSGSNADGSRSLGSITSVSDGSVKIEGETVEPGVNPPAPSFPQIHPSVGALSDAQSSNSSLLQNLDRRAEMDPGAPDSSKGLPCPFATSESLLSSSTSHGYGRSAASHTLLYDGALHDSRTAVNEEGHKQTAQKAQESPQPPNDPSNSPMPVTATTIAITLPPVDAPLQSSGHSEHPTSFLSDRNLLESTAVVDRGGLQVELSGQALEPRPIPPRSSDSLPMPTAATTRPVYTMRLGKRDSSTIEVRPHYSGGSVSTSDLQVTPSSKRRRANPSSPIFSPDVALPVTSATKSAMHPTVEVNSALDASEKTLGEVEPNIVQSGLEAPLHSKQVISVSETQFGLAEGTRSAGNISKSPASANVVSGSANLLETCDAGKSASEDAAPDVVAIVDSQNASADGSGKQSASGSVVTPLASLFAGASAKMQSKSHPGDTFSSIIAKEPSRFDDRAVRAGGDIEGSAKTRAGNDAAAAGSEKTDIFSAIVATKPSIFDDGTWDARRGSGQAVPAKMQSKGRHDDRFASIIAKEPSMFEDRAVRAGGDIDVRATAGAGNDRAAAGSKEPDMFSEIVATTPSIWDDGTWKSRKESGEAGPSQGQQGATKKRPSVFEKESGSRRGRKRS